MLRHFFFIFFLFAVISGYSQVPDSTNVVDSSVLLLPALEVKPSFDEMLYFKRVPEWKASSEMMYIAEKPVQSKDWLFYFLVGLVLYFAFVRILFPRYVYNMFTLFFQANFRRKQTSEQLQQDAFPALLLNIFFLVVMASFITQMAVLQGWTEMSFWEFGFYCLLILTGVVLIKYVFVRLVGLLAGYSAVAETYLFIIFLMNKLVAVISLPLLFFLSFCGQSQMRFAVLGVVIIVGIGVVFRYILSYKTLHKNLKTNPLQFFVYLCVVEFLPFLIFYEVLFKRFG